jgi:hypothetical protein
MFHLAEMYIGVEKGEKFGKEISNSALLEVRLRIFIIMQCPVYGEFVLMSAY